MFDTRFVIVPILTVTALLYGEQHSWLYAVLGFFAGFVIRVKLK